MVNFIGFVKCLAELEKLFARYNMIWQNTAICQLHQFAEAGIYPLFPIKHATSICTGQNRCLVTKTSAL